MSQYFKFAQELKQVAPIIAYSCDWLGTNLFITRLQKARKDGTIKKGSLIAANLFLSSKLKKLENDKAEVQSLDKTPEEVRQEQVY